MRRTDMHWTMLVCHMQARMEFESRYAFGDQQDFYRSDFLGMYINGGEL